MKGISGNSIEAVPLTNCSKMLTMQEQAGDHQRFELSLEAGG